MTLKEAIEGVKSKRNGAFRFVIYKKIVPVKKAYHGIAVLKIASTSCRFGINYLSVKNKNTDGTINSNRVDISQSLPWGNWSAGLFPYVIENNGSHYLRVTRIPQNQVKSTYIMVDTQGNKKELTKDEVELYCGKKELEERRNMVFDIKIENILEIR